jgi:hypothetical protein
MQETAQNASKPGFFAKRAASGAQDILPWRCQ